MPSTATATVTSDPLATKRKPWKYIGYRRFCEFIDSDNDFFVLRRFGSLHVRVLLALQDELAELEAHLQTLEGQLYDQAAEDIHNGSFRQEVSTERLELVREIDRKLRAYNELALQHSQLRARPRVARRDTGSVSNWFYNNRKAILEEETEYINKGSDLFSMVPKSTSPLRKLLEKSAHFRLARLWKKTPKIEDQNIHYMSDQRIDVFVQVINTTLGMAMLIAPLWILAFVNDTIRRLTVITAFLILFLCLVTFTTVARPFESLGATAAYAAVLVVFLQAS